MAIHRSIVVIGPRQRYPISASLRAVLLDQYADKSMAEDMASAAEVGVSQIEIDLVIEVRVDLLPLPKGEDEDDYLDDEGREGHLWVERCYAAPPHCHPNETRQFERGFGARGLERVVVTGNRLHLTGDLEIDFDWTPSPQTGRMGAGSLWEAGWNPTPATT